jgi:hypothetical protein
MGVINRWTSQQRYPKCLERVVKDTGGQVADANIRPYERDTVESRMIRFRYGPWDGRYRRWIGLMVARDLAATYVTGNTVNVLLTQSGREVADVIAKLDEYADLQARSKLIFAAVGGIAATKLKDFIYAKFPELLNMRWGQEIEL